MTEEIADELVKVFDLVPNFDVTKVGPTKYIRNQVTELYIPQCVSHSIHITVINHSCQDTKKVTIDGVEVHYVPLEDICREVLASSAGTELILNLFSCD